MIAPIYTPAPEHFDGLKVLVFGLGRFGGGAGAARFFASRGADVVVTDRLTADQLDDSVQALSDVPIRDWRLGGHDRDDFERADWIVVNPAVPPNNPLLEHARQRGRQLVTEVGLFLRWCPTPHVVGITGSNGKSTTTQLVHDMLQASGHTVHMGGNIGRSLLPELSNIGVEDRVVLELSSFQLARLGDTPRPLVVAITGLSSNHLDWHGSLQEYAHAKEEILRGYGGYGVERTETSVAVLPQRDCTQREATLADPFDAFAARWREQCALHGRRVIEFSGAPTQLQIGEGESIDSRDLPLQGTAQRANMACALACAQAAGATSEGCAHALRAFRSLPHRQELVLELGGVRYINDSKATTPCAAACALEAFGGGTQRAIWLAGGSSKGTPFDELANLARPHLKGAFFFGETAPELASALHSSNAMHHGAEPSPVMPVRIVPDLESAFAQAHALATPGDTVLLSPACASFDQYRNYEQRGEHFRELAQRCADS